MTVCRQDGPWCWDYTALSVVEFEAATQLGKHGALSPGYLAWAAQETDSQGSGGSNFGRADRGLENFGAVPAEVGGNPPASEGSIPPQPDQVIAKGKEFGDIEFRWLRFWNRSPMTDDQMEAVKGEIAKGHPVAVGMLWPNRTQFMSGTDILKVPSKKGVFDGHCVVLVGYEDDPAMPGGGTFEFRNSWGADWADGGYAKMPYALLTNCVNDAFSVEKVAPVRNDKEAVQIIDASSMKMDSLAGLQDMSEYGKAWDGNPQVLFQGQHDGDGFSLTVHVKRSGRYDVRAVITRAEDYGEFQVVFPDGSKSPTIEGAGPGVSRSKPLSLGTHRLKSGDLILRVQVVGKSPASYGHRVGIVALELR